MIARATLLALTLAWAVPAQAQSVRAEQSEEAAHNRDILVMLRMPPSHFRPNARYGGSYDDAASQAARKRIARQIARDNGLQVIESWPMPLIGVDCFVMRVPAGRSIDEVVAAVSRNGSVAWSQPVNEYETLASNDPLYATQPASTEWHLADLHSIATGRGVRIAVIDSGIDVGHPDLAGQFVTTRDFISSRAGTAEQHGTGVAGVIAAKLDNGVGIVGIAPGAKLLALRACSERRRTGNDYVSTCNSLSLARALQFAVERDADVINMSLSGPQDPLLASIIAVGLDRDIDFVTAFDPRRPGGGFPASIPGVVSVAEESLPSLPARVYRAPGRDIPTTQPGGRWYLVNGSSFAAAHITGLLALLREDDGPGSANRIARTPDGVVDACATLVAVTPDCRCSCAISRQVARRDD
jgi:subtilisin family serine protease